MVDQDGTVYFREQFQRRNDKLGFAMSRKDIRIVGRLTQTGTGKISYQEFLEAAAFGSDGQGMCSMHQSETIKRAHA